MTTEDTLPHGGQVSENGTALEAARVLALLDASRHSLAALSAAVDLASLRHAELVALYVEDMDLLSCAAFPFSCEIGAQSGLSRPLTHDSLEASIARQLQRVHQALAGAVAGRSLRHRLEVTRGQVAAAALTMAAPEDVLVLGKAGTTERWGTRLGSTSRRLILEAPCTVLLWDERHPFKRGPLRWLKPAAGENEAPPAMAEWLAALFEGGAPLPISHARELERNLAHASAGGLLLRRGELQRLLNEDPELIARVPLPLIVTP
ncbi:universal stress protein [Billgrantia ethanolica]|uniref:Universal stress protein n=1 Tax=Billgrantia ethanolica TaxID=2733486 RepID=A0ABS9A0E3_9GAMM|nr:universal stress protein [Halomonas ethanolica]MCE8002255.1 universal stress protein [Halomonas ethanolica]